MEVPGAFVGIPIVRIRVGTFAMSVDVPVGKAQGRGVFPFFRGLAVEEKAYPAGGEVEVIGFAPPGTDLDGVGAGVGAGVGDQYRFFRLVPPHESHGGGFAGLYLDRGGVDEDGSRYGGSEVRPAMFRVEQGGAGRQQDRRDKHQEQFHGVGGFGKRIGVFDFAKQWFLGREGRLPSLCYREFRRIFSW